MWDIINAIGYAVPLTSISRAALVVKHFFRYILATAEFLTGNEY